MSKNISPLSIPNRPNIHFNNTVLESFVYQSAVNYSVSDITINSKKKSDLASWGSDAIAINAKELADLLNLQLALN